MKLARVSRLEAEVLQGQVDAEELRAVVAMEMAKERAKATLSVVPRLLVDAASTAGRRKSGLPIESKKQVKSELRRWLGRQQRGRSAGELEEIRQGNENKKQMKKEK